MTCPFTDYLGGWWYSESTECVGPKLIGDINPTTREQGMYWPLFPDPFVHDIQPLSKVIVKILDWRVEVTSK